jgi:CRP-like cAMP-binding protein
LLRIYNINALEITEIFPVSKFQFNSNSIFQGLPENDLKMLEGKMVDQKYKKGQNIFVEGVYPPGIFYVKEGRIKKYKTNRDGRAQIIYICNKGELLGYTALLSDEPYPDSAATLEDSIVGFISKDVFLKVLSQSPILSIRLLKNLSHEFGVLVNTIASFAHQSVRERLALSLLILKDKFDPADGLGKPAEINLCREDLASMVGTAVETLVRVLHSFKEEELIETQGRKIRILNEDKLMKVADLH